MRFKIIFFLLFFLNFNLYSFESSNNLVFDNSNSFQLQEKVLKGFFEFSYSSEDSRIILKLNKSKHLEKEFLYVSSLSQGIGSNDIGLDRGQLGEERLVYFKKMGNKIMLIQPNLIFRSSSSNKLEKKSIDEAFAKSVLFGFNIYKSTNTDIFIDLTPFLMQDMHGVSDRLEKRGEGTYMIDENRSAIFLERTKNFPKNTEFDVMLTFSGIPTGKLLQTVTPSPKSVTVHQHHSFVELPDKNYIPREFDPRSGANGLHFFDYSTPVNETTKKTYILRHRLKKKNPSESISEAIEPIIYYLDNGTPEPVRSALIEGGMWWNQAFENAGYKNAFRIEILPENVDPLDVRYNVIQWIHRSTRGWSYGSSVVDPRTGEIIKGHVSLGSLRIRQDFMIAQSLSKDPYKYTDENDIEMLNMSINRIKQLSAHEIGHTLGFAHNFASSVNNRESVMDYPHPLIELVNGEIKLDNAYDEGIGEWDKTSVLYSYQDFPTEQNEQNQLNKILNDSYSKGQRFITDKDARPIGGAHPNAHLWDNGSNPIKEFNHLLKVRKVAMDNFSMHQLKKGDPISILRDRLVPIYFLHRYQIEAVSKLIGGQNFNYSVKGISNEKVSPVNEVIQRDALNALCESLNQNHVIIPKKILEFLPPFAFGSSKSRESFSGFTGPTFDLLSPVNSLSDLIFSFILNSERATRLAQQKVYYKNQLGLNESLDFIINKFFKTTTKDNVEQIDLTIRDNLIFKIIDLFEDKNSPVEVKSIVLNKLHELNTFFENFDNKQNDYFKFILKRFFEGKLQFESKSKLKIPDGSPIGQTLSCE
ncbi:MAG: peptidase [Flavobacteriaceae bacterium]|nr:peptidase [Flavobacteriaceae bacterium]